MAMKRKKNTKGGGRGAGDERKGRRRRTVLVTAEIEGVEADVAEGELLGGWRRSRKDVGKVSQGRKRPAEFGGNARKCRMGWRRGAEQGREGKTERPREGWAAPAGPREGEQGTKASRRTGILGGSQLGKAIILQHMQEGGLTGVVQTQEEDLGILAVKT